MLNPDPLFLEGNHVKVTTVYDEAHEKANPMVVGHTSGAWPGAPVSEWDFSQYASGANERRLEFLPPYPQGMVLTTPPSDENSLRGKLSDHLHPIYKNITREFFSDGKKYYSDAKKTQSYSADTYLETINDSIQKGAEKLPLTVKGRVAWVTSQTAPLHLHLTLVDGGYLNPDDRIVTINFHTAKVKSMTNLLTKEIIEVDGNQATVNVPCGLFAFFDIELEEELKVESSTTAVSEILKDQAKIKVYSGKGQITIIGAEGKDVRLTNMLGQIISRHKVTSNRETISSDSGIVLVNTGELRQKVFVR